MTARSSHRRSIEHSLDRSLDRSGEGATLAALLAAGLLLAAATAPAQAQVLDESNKARDDAPRVVSLASGSLAAGIFDRQAATALDVGVDIAGRHYALGAGARLRWLFVDGFRLQDWDERSEWANIVRYLNYARAHGPVSVALALGQLGGATLGHGAVIDGYASGLHIDHRHLGMQAHIEGPRVAGEVIVDDLVAPRIVGARGRWRRVQEQLEFSVAGSLGGDLLAPTSTRPTGHQALAIAGLDGQIQLTSRSGRITGAVYADLVAIATMAAGAHAGLSGHVRAPGVTFALRGEVRVGTDRYLPGFIGPLYEIDRRARPTMSMPGSPGAPMPALSQLDVVRGGGLGGLGSKFELRAQISGYGEMSAYYARRAGLADVLVARASAPYLRAVQVAAWLATEVGAGGEHWILASELRARISERWFAGAELTRMYSDRDGAPAPLWMASASFGATLGL